jgi:hypothetical protein
VLLPNADLAEIDPQKLHGYLLSKTHPIGRFKARFFAALGYAAERWQELEALVTLHLTDLRPVADDDLVAVRPSGSPDRRDG